MIRRLVLFLSLWPAFVTAEPAAIRSGEHESFSRLVITIGAGTQWDLSPSEQGYRLMLAGATDGFDTSAVFERIPRNRLVSLSSTQDQLDMQVECECHAEAFLWQEGRLVVDIIDGPDPSYRPQMRAEASPGDVPRAALPLPQLIPNLPDAMDLPNGLTLTETFAQFPEPDVKDDQEEAVRAETQTELSDTESALMESVAQAASQGFLTPNVTQIEPQEVEADPMPTDATPDDDTLLALDGRPGVGVSTALDDLARLGALVGNAVDAHCMPPDFFAASEWGVTDLSLHEQISLMAEDLAGEFGVETTQAQTDLAKLYLHFGLGAEARVVLDADAAMSQERSLMYELAGLIDDYDEPHSLIQSQSGCQGPGAVWALLAGGAAPASDQTRNEVLRDFFALPTGLRTHLAPRMSDVFLSFGDDEAAEMVLRPVLQESFTTDHEVQVARAEVALQQDRPEEAIALLEEQVQDNGRATPETLIRLIDLKLEDGSKPAEADLYLAAAMRSEYSDTPIAEDLARAEARGWTVLGDYAQAIGLLAERSDDPAVEDRNTIYRDLASNAGSADFLEFAFRSVPTDLHDVTENEMAQRLLDLGFPERALAVMSGSAVREAAAERRYLRASAALEMEDYGATLDAIVGLTDDRARQLRSDAYVGLGEYDVALTALDAEEEASSPTLQFRAQAWERLTLENDPVLADFANSYLSPAAAASETLADRREILERSQESRRMVGDLLLRFDGLGNTEVE